MTTSLVNVSNPAAFGVEWKAGETGSRYQLVNVRGTTGLLFGVKVQGASGWSTMPVVDPSRFGMDSPPRTFAEFRKVAENYIDA